MKFYNLDGKGIKKEEFVDLYSKDYFLRDDPLFKHNRSSSHIEDEITKILENGIHNGEEGKREVARILAWKVGKIDHEESQKNQRFEYIIDWKNAETLEGVKIVGKYPIKDAVEYIVREKNELAEKDPQDFLNELKDKEIGRLKSDNSKKDKIIDKLLAEKQVLKQQLQKFKSFWHKTIGYFQNKINYSQDKNFKEVAKELFINKVFEIYPGIVRKYIAERVKNISKVQHRITYYPLYKCENHEKELSNNVLFCLRLLEKYDYYKISEIIRNLIGHYDDKVFEILKPIIQEKKYLKEIVELLRVLDVSLQGWNAFELIISVNDDEEIYREIDTILFSVFGTGEHGISESFNQRYNFFNKLPINSDTNSNVKEYIKRQKLRFKKLAQSERLKETQKIIEEKTEYEISTKKSTSKDEEE